MSGQRELPDRSIGRGPTVGFWEHSPENWGIVQHDPGEGMADWTAVIPKFPERKPSSGLDPYTMRAARMTASMAARGIGAVGVATARRHAGRADRPPPAYPGGASRACGTGGHRAAAAYKAPGARPALGV